MAFGEGEVAYLPATTACPNALSRSRAGPHCFPRSATPGTTNDGPREPSFELRSRVVAPPARFLTRPPSLCSLGLAARAVGPVRRRPIGLHVTKYNGLTDGSLFRRVARWERRKLPMTEVVGFPPQRGFGPHSTTVRGGLRAQRSAGVNCSVPSGVLSPGFIRQGAGPRRDTFAATRRRGDRLAHTILGTRSVLMCSKIVPRFSNAFILGGLPTRHRHGTWRERRGVIRPRVRGRHTAFARPQVLRTHQNGVTVPGTAPAPAPVRLRYDTMRHALKHTKRTDSNLPTGHSAVVASVSGALPPTPEGVGFRATRP